jgi:hypothetical protein
MVQGGAGGRLQALQHHCVSGRQVAKSQNCRKRGVRELYGSERKVLRGREAVRTMQSVRGKGGDVTMPANAIEVSNNGRHKNRRR